MIMILLIMLTSPYLYIRSLPLWSPNTEIYIIKSLQNTISYLGAWFRKWQIKSADNICTRNRYNPPPSILICLEILFPSSQIMNRHSPRPKIKITASLYYNCYQSGESQMCPTFTYYSW